MGCALGCAPGVYPGTGAGTGAGTVAGTLTYRERVALPSDAIVEISLQDVSRQDAAALVIAKATVMPNGRQVPIPFGLRYDTNKIDSNRTYGIRAAIYSGGQMLFTTDTQYPVITRGHPMQVDLLLKRVAVESVGGLSGTAWRLEDLSGAGVVDRVEATLEFPEAGKVSGNGSCNRFSGYVEISGESIKVGPLGSTRMACVEAVGNQERKYLRALQDADRFALGKSVLLIYVKGMKQPLRFVQKEP